MHGHFGSLGGLLAPFLETLEVIEYSLLNSRHVSEKVAGVHFELSLGGPLPVQKLHDSVEGPTFTKARISYTESLLTV